ncbi:hypothetical protein B9Z19DRAFT_1065869 [Tuber borchii]|uniref:Uncharacterized protein n=1 Tax=Tuber borchii TaxID=42251 RepID=A0A2T6ZPG1_TUBBO|nr:hypothetical protein B9Z19DRAFT_1065869 [Tuber borchii]
MANHTSGNQKLSNSRILPEDHLDQLCPALTQIPESPAGPGTDSSDMSSGWKLRYWGKEQRASSGWKRNREPDGGFSHEADIRPGIGGYRHKATPNPDVQRWSWDRWCLRRCRSHPKGDDWWQCHQSAGRDFFPRQKEEEREQKTGGQKAER